MKRNPWPYAITAALLAIIGMQVVLVSLATANRPTLESKDANGYHSSTVWDAERTAFTEARALGWRLAIDGQASAVDYRLTDSEPVPEPVIGLSGEVLVGRADGRVADRTLPMSEVGPGVYRFDHTGLPTGLYRVRVELRRGSAKWLDERWLPLP